MPFKINSGEVRSYQVPDSQAAFRKDLQKIQTVKPRDLLWIDDKGKLHSDGFFRQFFYKVKEKLFGEHLHGYKLSDKLVALITGSGREKGWLSDENVRQVKRGFQNYQQALTAGKTAAYFNNLITFEPEIPPKKTVQKPSKEDAAAARLQALVRGRKTRDLVVMPSQVLPYLEKYMLQSAIGRQDLSDIAMALCREINAVTLESKLKPGDMLKLAAFSTKHKIPVFRGSEYVSFREVTLEFTGRLKLEKDGKSLNVFIQTTERLGSGTYKEVFKAQDFNIPLMLDRKSSSQSTVKSHGLGEPSIGKRQVGYEPLVYMTSDGEEAETVEKAILIQKKLKEILGDRIPPLPEALSEAPRPEDAELELKQKWYNSDLAKAAAAHSIPLDISERPKRLPFTSMHCLQILLDVAKTIEIMHQHGFVHRDVKPPNILVDVDKLGVIGGGLNDFDLVTATGDKGAIDQSNYQYWDTSARKGIPSPLTDCYGLAVSFAEALVPDFHVIRDHPGTLNLPYHIPKAIRSYLQRSSQIDAPLLNRLSRCESSEEVQNIIDPMLTEPARLVPKEAEALRTLKRDVILIEAALKLAGRLINESAQVYAHIEKNPKLKAELTTNNRSLFGKSAEQRRQEAADSLKPMYTSMSQIVSELAALQKQIQNI